MNLLQRAVGAVRNIGSRITGAVRRATGRTRRIRSSG